MANNASPLSQRLIALDPWLEPYGAQLRRRLEYAQGYAARILGDKPVADFARGYEHFGLHATSHGWVLREWAPAATAIYLHCEASQWADSDDFAFEKKPHGEWELRLAADTLQHEYKRGCLRKDFPEKFWPLLKGNL